MAINHYIGHAMAIVAQDDKSYNWDMETLLWEPKIRII